MSPGPEQAEVILLLFLPVAALTVWSERTGVPYPIALVLGGLALSFVPGLPAVPLEPDAVLLFMLPPLLYVAAFATSWREFRRNLLPISMLACGLVLFTTVTVAAAAHALVPQLTWPAAFALGAIVSPPDAVAATAIFNRLGVPRRVVTILEGESLVNDASALVVYRFAVAAALTGRFSPAAAGLEFARLLVGGVALGLVVGWLASWVRARAVQPAINVTFALLTPYAAYLPAERLGVSSVLAAVTAGLVAGWHGPAVIPSAARLQSVPVWQMIEYLLNGLIFILIGLQLPHVVRHLSAYPLGQLLGDGVVVSALVIVLRLVWVYPAVYLPRWVSPGFRARDPAPPWRDVTVVAWSGMRGVVSLAAALALPSATMGSTGGFPGRDLIVFLTFCVILATLVLQGLSLPRLVRWLGVTRDGLAEREEAVARLRAANSALAYLDRAEAGEEPPPGAGKPNRPAPAGRAGPVPAADPAPLAAEEAAELLAPLRRRFERERHEAEILQPSGPFGGYEDTNRRGDSRALERGWRLGAIAAQRRVLLQMRRYGEIHDEVLHRLEHELDVDELRARADENAPV